MSKRVKEFVNLNSFRVIQDKRSSYGSKNPLLVVYFGVQKDGKFYQRFVYGYMNLMAAAGGFLNGLNNGLKLFVFVLLYVKINTRLVSIIMKFVELPAGEENI